CTADNCYTPTESLPWLLLYLSLPGSATPTPYSWDDTATSPATAAKPVAAARPPTSRPPRSNNSSPKGSSQAPHASNSSPNATNSTAKTSNSGNGSTKLSIPPRPSSSSSLSPPPPWDSVSSKLSPCWPFDSPAEPPWAAGSNPTHARPADCLPSWTTLAVTWFCACAWTKSSSIVSP